jgi:hypothetical protein
MSGHQTKRARRRNRWRMKRRRFGPSVFSFIMSADHREFTAHLERINTRLREMYSMCGRDWKMNGIG